MDDALSPAPALTLDDTTATLSEAFAGTTRYLGVLYVGSSPLSPDTPFVLSTVAEAHALLAAIHEGTPLAPRVLYGSAIVETALQPTPVDEDVALLLWRMEGDAVDIDEEHPHLHVRVGPRGGITHGPA